MPYDYVADITAGTSVNVQSCQWGKGVVTATAVEKGDVLWSEPPIFLGLSTSDRGNLCAQCLRVLKGYSGPCPLPAVPAGCEQAGYRPWAESCEAAEPVACAGGCELYCSGGCRDTALRRGHRELCGEAYRALLRHLQGGEERNGNQRLLALKLCTAKLLGRVEARRGLDAAQGEGADKAAGLDSEQGNSATKPSDLDDTQGEDATQCGDDALDLRTEGMARALVQLGHTPEEETLAEQGEEGFFRSWCAPLFFEGAGGGSGARVRGFCFEEFMAALWQVRANAVELDLSLRTADPPQGGPSDGNTSLRASGLFALQAFVNHSCVPTGHRVMHNGRLHFVTVRGIAASGEVLMAYVNPAQGVKERQAKLSHWKISCTCDKCFTDAMKLVMFRKFMDGLKANRKASVGDPSPQKEDAASAVP
ncbi:hypothetical protein DIPPA_29620 [Diplonema papillatum]|nr:hypothetical protein DIPPA_29620 [Diplonema papillatum]